MGKTRSQLRHVGYWPDSPAPVHHPAGLPVAARRLAEAALEELGQFDVVVTLDQAGKARFRVTRILPPAARLAIERHSDLIEAYLVERAPRPITPRRRLGVAGRSSESAALVHPEGFPERASQGLTVLSVVPFREPRKNRQAALRAPR